MPTRRRPSLIEALRHSRKLRRIALVGAIGAAAMLPAGYFIGKALTPEARQAQTTAAINSGNANNAAKQGRFTDQGNTVSSRKLRMQNQIERKEVFRNSKEAARKAKEEFKRIKLPKLKYKPLSNIRPEDIEGRIPAYERLLAQTKAPRDRKAKVSAERILVLQFIASEFAAAHGIKPEDVLGQIMQESTFNEKAVGRNNDLGLMQITPLAEEEIMRLGLRRFSNDRKWNTFDPLCNLDAGIGYLRYLMNMAAKRGIVGYDNQLQAARGSYNKGLTGYFTKKEKRQAGKAYAAKVANRAKAFAGIKAEAMYARAFFKHPTAFQ
ncbi:MAG: transglycosylase SLT domain-containing protein [archaeon]